MYKKLSKNLQRAKEYSDDLGDVKGCLKERAEKVEKYEALIRKLWNEFPSYKYPDVGKAILDFTKKNQGLLDETISASSMEWIIYDELRTKSIRDNMDYEALQAKKHQRLQSYYQTLIRKLKGEK